MKSPSHRSDAIIKSLRLYEYYSPKYVINPHVRFKISLCVSHRCHNECDGVSNHRHLDCLLNCEFRRRSKNTSKLRVTGLYEGNSPVTCEVPAHRVSNAENVSIWCRHQGPLWWAALISAHGKDKHRVSSKWDSISLSSNTGLSNT